MARAIRDPLRLPFRELCFVVVDVETSGFSPRIETVIEIGVSVHQGGREVKNFQSLIGPAQLVPPFITALTGIRTRDLEKAPLFADVVTPLSLCFAGADFFVAHNVTFDRSFLEVAFTECRRELPPLPWVDPVPLARRRHGFAKLTKLSAHYGLNHDGAHHALDDARVTAAVLDRLATELSLVTLEDLLAGAPTTKLLPETTATTNTANATDTTKLPPPKPPTTTHATNATPTPTTATANPTAAANDAAEALRLKLFR